MTHTNPALAAKPSASIYRHPGFLAFISARLMAVFATQIQAVVVAWQVYDLTRDPLALAYVGLAQFLPMLCLLLPAGDLIDRFNRKAILASSWAVGAVCSGALWWLSGHTTAGAAGVAGVYAVLVLFGCSRAFSGPALQSLLPQVVPREQLAAAIAANSMLMRAASIGGPLLGGVLYALGGGRLTYALCFVCFALGTALLSRVAPCRPAMQRRLRAPCGNGLAQVSVSSAHAPSSWAPFRWIFLRCCWAVWWPCCPSTPAKCCT